MHDERPDYLPPKLSVSELIAAARREIENAPGNAEWAARAEAERRDRREQRKTDPE